MAKTGYADLPLHVGTVPKWLADRMMLLGTSIIESLVINFGRDQVITRLADPLWFQSFGAVMGMDWHSSGITTSVMYALKRGLNPLAKELGIIVCGGRGKYSRKTVDELRYIGNISSLDGDNLIRTSRLCAKVDNTALQDGFQLYQHNFIVTCDGKWAVVQQGMNPKLKTARRYHWSSIGLSSFINTPHAGVVGENQGLILNLTDNNAKQTRDSVLSFTKENPDRILKEAKKIQESLQNKNERNIVLPAHHEVLATDVNLKRLGAVLTTAYESNPSDFESFLLSPGLGPRTLQSLTLVSEVIYGTPSRFNDPARFSFAHGGKDGHPFPVPLRIYDETIRILKDSIQSAKLGYSDKNDCLKRLYTTEREIEQKCSPKADFDKTLEHEWKNSGKWGGRTVGSSTLS